MADLRVEPVEFMFLSKFTNVHTHKLPEERRKDPHGKSIAVEMHFGHIFILNNRASVSADGS